MEDTHKKVFFSGRTIKVRVHPHSLELSSSWGFGIFLTDRKKWGFFLVVQGV